MKKLFFLAAAVLATMTINAAGTTGSWQFAGNTAPDLDATVDGTNIKIYFLASDASKKYSVEDAGYNAAVPDDMKVKDKKSLKLGANANYLKITPIDASGEFAKQDTLYICGYNKMKISSTAEQTGDISASLATGTGKSDQNIAKVAFPANTKEVYITRAEGSGTGVSAIKIVAFNDPGDPVLNSDKDALDLAIARTGATEKKDSFVLSGIHLDKVAELKITFPDHEGLTISSTTITPESDGSLEQKFFVTYAPKAEEDEFSGNIVVKADANEFNIALKCNKKVAQEELKEIAGDATWDFGACGQSADVVPYDKNDTLIFFNVAEGWAATFPADQIAGKGQYFYYNANKCFQGSVLRIKTSAAGKLEVIYSNTGNRTEESDRRFLTINGVKVGEGSMKSSEKDTISDIAVEAGEILIGGLQGTDPQMLRFYKVVFKAAAAPGEEKSKDASISSMKINGKEVAEKEGVFAYEVPAEENLAKVKVEFELAAKATADKESPLDIEVPAAGAAAKEETINVTAEDGVTKKAYTISITKKAASVDPEPDDQAVENVSDGKRAFKIFENGQLVIIKNGIKYDVTGAVVK